jgi:hypothetical protein
VHDPDPRISFLTKVTFLSDDCHQAKCFLLPTFKASKVRFIQKIIIFGIVKYRQVIYAESMSCEASPTIVKAMDKRAFEKLVNGYGCYIEASRSHQIVKTKDDDVVVAYIAISHPAKIYLSWAVKEFYEGVERLGLTTK